MCASNVSNFHSYHQLNYLKNQYWKLCETRLLNVFSHSKSSMLSDANITKNHLLTSYEKIREVVQDDFLEFNNDVKKVCKSFLVF